MALHIVNPRADALARELAELTGQNLSTAVVTALEEKLQQVRNVQQRTVRLERMREIARESARLCQNDHRHPDEILDYDEVGLPR